MIQSGVFTIVSPIAYVVNELLPPFFFTGGFACFSTIDRLNFSIFLAYVIGERHYDVSAWFKAITLLMDIWLRVEVKTWYRRSGDVTRAYGLWGLSAKFKGCRGVVERCVVVQRGTEGVRCGNGTVPMKALLYESVLNVNHPPVWKRFFRPYN